MGHATVFRRRIRAILPRVRVAAARFDEANDQWVVETSDGTTHRARYCVMTTGLLSAPLKPDIKRLESFQGPVYHTGQWPQDPVGFTGQRVGVIGTGSSAIQTIPIVAEQASHLTVFQRTPGDAVPLRNHPMPAEYQSRVKANDAEWRRRERFESFGGWVAMHYQAVELTTTMALDCTPAERRARYDDRWKNGGLALYYETYNQDHVELVDVSTTPIQEITPTGVKVDGVEYACDSRILATGYDAMTGALTRMHIEGFGGVTITAHWAQRARTYLGLMCAGFPNLFIIDQVNSWYLGANISGKSHRGLIYLGGMAEYRRWCAQEPAQGYPGFVLEGAAKREVA